MTSIWVPWRAKPGSFAVTMTAATFLVLRAAVAGIDAEPLQHADQAFPGEDRLVQRVAGAVEPDHQAVADQHVLADALEIGDVLDARGGVGRAGQGEKAEQPGKAEEPGEAEERGGQGARSGRGA